MMAASITDRRKQLLGLPTHQHRLRHLKSIAVRNLSLPKSVKFSDLSKLQTYFTLHPDVKQKAFFESEKITGSLNPNFKGFDLTLDPAVNTSSSYFVIRVWAGEDEQFALVIEWIVDLSGLSYLGENIHKDDHKYQPNTLLYGMFDGFFGADDERKVLEDKDQSIFDLSVKVDMASVKTSYSVNSLSRVLTVVRAVKQTEKSVKRVRHSLEDRLIRSQNRARKMAEYELLLLRVQQCREELTVRTQTLQRKSDQLDQLTQQNHQADIDIKRKSDALERDQERLHEKRKRFIDCRESFIKTNSLLCMRRKQLIGELAVIYPVEESSDHKFTISGVHLPNAEDYQGADDMRLNVALGSTAHMLLMICHFLDIRTRYQIDHLVSKSKIHDHIIDRVPDNSREFPLHGRRKDRLRFNYGVFLLNKCIAQLRDYCGLGTKDLRLTLPNLRTLLELRLGVRFDVPSNSTFRRNLLSDRALLQRVGRLQEGGVKSSKDQSCDSSRERAVPINNNNSPQRSRESSQDRADQLYKSISPDYSPKTNSNGLSESEDGRHLPLSDNHVDHVADWISNGDKLDEEENDDDVDDDDDDDDIDARVEALSSRSSSFKMALTVSSETEEADVSKDPVV